MGGVGVRFLGVEQHHCPLTAIKSLEELDWPPSSQSLVLPTACGIENPYEKILFLKAAKSMWIEEPIPGTGVSNGMAGGADLTKAWRPPLQCRQSVVCSLPW